LDESKVTTYQVYKYFSKGSKKLMERCLQSDAGKLVEGIAGVFCCEGTTEEEKTRDLIKLFLSMMERFGIAPQLVIDKANMLISDKT
jgi:hypothetical protein